MTKVPRREQFQDDDDTFDDVETNYRRPSSSNKSRAGTVDTGSLSGEFLRDEEQSHRSKRRGKRHPKPYDIDEDDCEDDEEEESKKCSWCRVCWHLGICCCLLISISVVIVAVLYLTDKDEAQKPAVCNGCHCIAEPASDTEESTCPSSVPPITFSNDVVEALMKQEALNAVQATCNPFDEDCSIPNPLLPEDTATAVCGLHYNDKYCTQYRMQTYPDRDIAVSAGAHVTHTGACGVCSTTQDLSVLLQFVDLDTVTQHCGNKAVSSKSKGQSCYQDLGFTEACASLFADAARHSERHCAVKCVVNDLRNTPFNEEGGDCALNTCLQCKEEKTVQTFNTYAGRTKGTSGLLSAVARPCSQLADITHMACPDTRPLNG